MSQVITAAEYKEIFKKNKSKNLKNLGLTQGSEISNFEVNPNNPEIQNNTEKKYERDVLIPLKQAGEIVEYFFNRFKIRLAKNCWYTIDYFVLLPNCCKAIDVKGKPPTDDSIVKIKTAAELCPQFVWVFSFFDKDKRYWIERKF